MVIIAATSAAIAWIMSDIFDAIIGSEDKKTVYLVAVAVAAIFTLRGFASYIQVVFLSRAGNSIVASLQKRLFRRIMNNSLSFFSDGASSDLVVRMTHSAAMARQVIDTIVVGFVRDLLTLIGLFAVMIHQQPTLTLICVVFGPLALWGIRQILSRVREIMAAEMQSLAEIIKVVQETSTGIRVIKAFELESTMNERMKNAASAVETRSNQISKLAASTSPLMETLSGFAIAAIVALSTVNIFGSQSNSVGQFMSFITALLMSYEPAKRLARMRVNIETGMIGVSLMYEIFDIPLKMTETENPQDIDSKIIKIEMKNVSFSYGDRDLVLQGLDINFKVGKTTALVGPSGGGKSTILNLMLRLYDPTTGHIEINGIDLKNSSYASLRNLISYVGQETFLFSDTIRSNIAVGNLNATDDQIEDAAKRAFAHEFILDQPDGYNTFLGENGGGLSGGQRQRIAIARAFLGDSQLLILDEATNALDAESEVLVQKALDNRGSDQTTIIVAHRLATVMNADEIIVIEDGQVSERGHSTELKKNEDGLFTKLCKHQFMA